MENLHKRCLVISLWYKLRLIRSKMINNKPEEVTVIGFPFTYRKHTYNSLLKLADYNFNKKGYYILLEFSKDTTKSYNKNWFYMAVKHNATHNWDSLAVKVGPRSYCTNSKIVGKAIYKFFGTSMVGRKGFLITNFSKALSNYVPKFIPKRYNPSLKTDITTSLSHSAGEDPKAIYCIGLKHNQGIKRNGNPYSRSHYNSEKASHLIPKVYSEITNGTSKKASDVSFRFSEDKSKEKDSEEILKEL